MSAASRACLVACAVLPAVLFAIPASAAPRAAPPPASWSEVFADEADTVVFLSHDALVRAPFSMATRDTLWRADDGGGLTRVLASPDRRRLAWLSRVSDRGLTTLWLWDADGVRRRAGFAALRPSDYEESRSAAMRPTVDDEEATGARLAVSGTFTRTALSNAMVWDWDGSGVWFAFRQGIARAPVDTDSVRVMSPALVLDIRRLDPAPMLLAEVMRLDKGRYSAVPWDEPTPNGRFATGPAPMPPNPDLSNTQPVTPSSDLGTRVVTQLGTYLLYPGRRELKAFLVNGLDPSDPWTASEDNVWWVDGGHRVSAVTVADPRGTAVVEDHDPIVWIEYLSSRRALVRATGRTLVERPDATGVDRTVLSTGSPIRAVVAAPDDPARYVVTRDSLVVWQPATGATRVVGLGGANPRRVLVAASGARLFVGGGFSEGGGPLRMDRLDPGAATLVPLVTPVISNPVVALTPSGRRLLLYGVSEHAPGTAQVCDLDSGVWREVKLPRILGWERPVR
ncbi:MAG: hypothetical protein ACHQ52_07065 [Candidatus Eisenbacteria bacterium]